MERTVLYAAWFLAAAFVVFILCISEPAHAYNQGDPEYRAFWVDAWGNGFLSQSQVDQLLGVVGDANSKGDIRNANCNAVFIQVRRNADACYPSSMGEPYFSSGLSPSNFNALQAVINAAHDTTGGKQRIEVHCWIVTFRTSGGTVYAAHHDTPTASLTALDNYWPTRDDSGNEVSGDLPFDPGHPKVLDYLSNVCMDLVNHFDIDGIHYDYIRFTANNQGYNPTSLARYNARYGLTGQPAATDPQWQQWRRDQVTALVRQVYAKIQAVKPNVKQSGSFVTWNPSPVASTRAAFQNTRPYYDVYADWDSWMQEGIVDMAVPMTYYDWSSLPGDYTNWINFEKDRKFNRFMVIGPGIYLNSLPNAILELQQTRNPSPSGNYANGFSGYSYRVPYSGGTWSGFQSSFVSGLTSGGPVPVPTMPWKASPTKGHMSGRLTYAGSGAWADGATVSITGPESRSQYCDGTGFYAFIDLTPGAYTITVSKAGYVTVQKSVTVAIGSVTGNMYVNDFQLGVGPVISGAQATNITPSSATITWNTDHAADSQVEYGLTASYGTSTPLDSTQVTSHSIVLTGLSPKTTYHFRVHSTNGSGPVVSGDYTFMTDGPPIITNVQAQSITMSSAIVTWNTDAQADSTVNYGLTSGYGSQAFTATKVMSHSITLSGLTPNTTYHYQCISANPYGSDASADYSFTTSQSVPDIVIDNTDPGWANTSPGSNTWSAGSAAGVPKIGTNYLYYAGDGSTTQSSATRRCTWTPTIAVDGLYDVWVYYQIGSNRNSAAPYKVYCYGSSVPSVQNQNGPPSTGGWFQIGGNLPFRVGTSGYVELTTLSTDTKYVSADAAKWVFKSAINFNPPTLSIGAPSATLAGAGPVSYTVSFANADTISLAAGNITLNKTGTANGTISISGTGNTTRSVMISSITGSGTLGISIAAGTATSSYGGSATGAGPSATFSVDGTAPITTSCQDDQYTTSTTSLHATWSATDAESGIARYEYAVGTTSLGNDVKDWTSAGTATDYTIGGLTLTASQNYFISMRAVNGAGLTSNPISSAGVTVATPVASVHDAKALADGQAVALPSTMVVSAPFASKFYMEDANRLAGIRVESATGLAAGRCATVFGILGIADDCERAILSPKVIAGAAGSVVNPFGIVSAAAGGATSALAPGTTNGSGLNNIGLLVKIAGKATKGVFDGFYLDDGSNLTDDTGNTGIKVWTGASGSSYENLYVVVTGVVSCRKSGGMYPQILSRGIVTE